MNVSHQNLLSVNVRPFHTFTSSGTLNVTNTTGILAPSTYLISAGGGSGGLTTMSDYMSGGGGGAGG